MRSFARWIGVLLPLGIVIAIAVFSMRNRSSEDTPRARADSRPAFSALIIFPTRDLTRGLPSPRDAATSPRNAKDDTLAVIRLKLRQLSETRTADKEAQDELVTCLRAILNDDNAAEITRALSADELHSQFGLAALQHWLKVDVATAADWFALRTDATDEQMGAVAHELLEDRVALDLYCAQLPDPAWRQAFLKNAAREAMWRDPVEAIHLVQRMNPGSAQTDLLQTTACAWMIGNPTAASDWIAHLPDSLLREQLVCAGAKTRAGADPLQAINWLISCVPIPSEESEPLINETVQDIFGTWAESEPAQAAKAVAQFLGGDLRTATVDLVARRWLERDPAAAADWIKNLPERDRIQTIAHAN